MPRVPRYQQQVRQAALPTPNVRVDPGAAFAGPAAAVTTAGQGLQQVGGVMAQAQERIEKARDQADATLLLEREAQFDAALNETLYTGQDAFMRTAGRSAAEREKAALERLEQMQAKLGEGLSERAMQTWRLRTGARLQDVRRRTAGHVHQQLGVAREAAARLAEQEGLSIVANVWSDPEAFELQKAAMLTAARAAEDVDEAKALRVQQVAAKVEVTAIGAAIQAGELDWAEERLKLAGDTIPPQMREPLRRTVETAKADRAADGRIAGIILGSVDERTGWVNEAAVWREVDAAPPKERDALRQRAVQRLQEAIRARNAEVEAVYSRALSGYLNAGSRGIASEDRAWLVQRAPDEWRRLQQMMRAGADRWRTERDRREREAALKVTEEQRVVESEIRARIQADPEGWAARPVQDILADAEELGVTLAPSQVRTLGTVLAGVKGRVAKDEREGRTVGNAEWKAQVDADIASLGIRNKKQQTAARAYLNERRNRYMDENNGKAPPRDEVARWRTEAFTQYDGGLLRPHRYGFERPTDASDDPLPVDRQRYAPARNALGADETIIEGGIDLRGEAETGSFALDGSTGNATTPEGTVAPEREAARAYLRARGRQGTPEEIDALLDAARRRADGVTSGAGERQR